MQDMAKVQENEYPMEMIMHVHLPAEVSTDLPVAGFLLSLWKSAN